MGKNKEPAKEIDYQQYYKVLKLENAFLRIQINKLNQFKGFQKIK